MRRVAALLLLVWFAVLGSGAASYLHDLQHRHDDAVIVAATPHDAGRPAPPAPQHDETICTIHAQLAAPVALITFTSTVASATFTDIALAADAICIGTIHADHFDRRGPPA